MHLPLDPAAFLEPLIERAKAGVLAVSKTATDGILRVDDELHLTPLEPLADDPKVTKLRAVLDRRVSEAQLPELILAVDAEVRFSWIMLGREPRSSTDGVRRDISARHGALCRPARAHGSATIGRLGPPSHEVGKR